MYSTDQLLAAGSALLVSHQTELRLRQFSVEHIDDTL